MVSPCTASSIEKVVIPPNVTEIGESAFELCKNLKNIQWGGNETKIGMNAFFIYTYSAKATVTKKGKAKDYAAENITKIKADKKTVSVKKGTAKVWVTLRTTGKSYQIKVKVK